MSLEEFTEGVRQRKDKGRKKPTDTKGGDGLGGGGVEVKGAGSIFSCCLPSKPKGPKELTKKQKAKILSGCWDMVSHRNQYHNRDPDQYQHQHP